MPLNWDALVLGPLNDVFGEPCTYAPKSGAPFAITAIFDSAYRSVVLDGNGDPSTISVAPVAGCRLSEFPANFDPETAQKDQLTRLADGAVYSVKACRIDGKGHARIELMKVR